MVFGALHRDDHVADLDLRAGDLVAGAIDDGADEAAALRDVIVPRSVGLPGLTSTSCWMNSAKFAPWMFMSCLPGADIGELERAVLADVTGADSRCCTRASLRCVAAVEDDLADDAAGAVERDLDVLVAGLRGDALLAPLVLAVARRARCTNR